MHRPKIKLFGVTGRTICNSHHISYLSNWSVWSH